MLIQNLHTAITSITLYLFFGFASGQNLFSGGLKCRKEHQTFEVMSGYIHVSPADLILTIPESLHLADCLSKCRRNSACLSVNFETGLCVLFNSSALTRNNTLSQSNFPVFTIYAQKICYTINVNTVCKNREWAFETVKGYQLANPSFVLRKIDKLSNRIECMERCLLESEFTCRSVNYFNDGTCEIMEVNRHAIASNFHFEKYFVKSNKSVDYLESNCVQEANDICSFKRIRNKVLKTVDSLYDQIVDENQCKKLCLNANIRCHSYTLGDKDNKACRISHLSTNSLSHIVEPYMITPGADTYELTSCYNITVSCESREMTAHVLTNRLFSGKVYGKNKPKSCVNDIYNSLTFNLTMPYNDINCEVQQANFSRYHKDIVIQHHDLIVTTKDIGLSVHCSYDLTNRTVMNSIRIEEDIEGKEADDRYIHSSFVYSPNVTIQIKDAFGQDVKVARVGDSLTLRFVIDDENTPYEIFIRELVASDGTDSNQITLIDSDGCPTDVSIFGAINKRLIKRNDDKLGSKVNKNRDDRKGGNNLDDSDDLKNTTSNGKKSVVDKLLKSARIAANNEYEFNLNAVVSHQLEGRFEAFKFPTTNIVQFKAIVTPCLGKCTPANCKTENPDGTIFTLNSYGRRRRRSIDSNDYMNKFKTQRSNDRKLDKNMNDEENGEEEAVIVFQSIRIQDNFAFDKEAENLLSNEKEIDDYETKNSENENLEKVGLKVMKKSNTILNCLSSTTIGLLILLLVIIQIGFIVFWIYFRRAVKSTKNKQWWTTSFDNQIDSIRYSNSQYSTNPSFYKSSSNSKPTSIISSRNAKI